ncbi:hypothetical protein [Vibrio nigripulchritudo]|uniref:hypothetical protein n=1 Tax=Vibrio nigripulchritudo TaxID=28173 RepID=UPI0019092605|nr:hypothetical protein [Vibrio nigripulchritudo]
MSSLFVGLGFCAILLVFVAWSFYRTSNIEVVKVNKSAVTRLKLVRVLLALITMIALYYFEFLLSGTTTPGVIQILQFIAVCMFFVWSPAALRFNEASILAVEVSLFRKSPYSLHFLNRFSVPSHRDIVKEAKLILQFMPKGTSISLKTLALSPQAIESLKVLAEESGIIIQSLEVRSSTNFEKTFTFLSSFFDILNNRRGKSKTIRAFIRHYKRINMLNCLEARLQLTDLESESSDSLPIKNSH